VHVYEWEQFDLVDTPGLQSTKGSHSDVALDAYPDATAIIYLLQPNLLVGNTMGIERVLKGDRAAGLVPKLDRTIFVIHRSDELGRTLRSCRACASARRPNCSRLSPRVEFMWATTGSSACPLIRISSSATGEM
jgi:hypothetical protein